MTDSNVINVPNFGDGDEGGDYDLPRYSVVYEQDGKTITEEIDGHAVITNTFIGFVDNDQVLRFAILAVSMKTITLVKDSDEEGPTVQ